MSDDKATLRDAALAWTYEGALTLGSFLCAARLARDAEVKKEGKPSCTVDEAKRVIDEATSRIDDIFQLVEDYGYFYERLSNDWVRVRPKGVRWNDVLYLSASDAVGAMLSDVLAKMPSCRTWSERCSLLETIVGSGSINDLIVLADQERALIEPAQARELAEILPYVRGTHQQAQAAYDYLTRLDKQSLDWFFALTAMSQAKREPFAARATVMRETAKRVEQMFASLREIAPLEEVLDPSTREGVFDVWEGMTNACIAISNACAKMQYSTEEYKRWGDSHNTFKDVTDTLREALATILSESSDDAGSRDSNEMTSAKQKSALPRLEVDLAKKTITLDGQTYDVSSENALRWLKVLTDRPGEWISGRELKHFDNELDGARTDRLRGYLPSQILDLIDSDTGKGSRIRLA